MWDHGFNAMFLGNTGINRPSFNAQPSKRYSPEVFTEARQAVSTATKPSPGTLPRFSGQNKNHSDLSIAQANRIARSIADADSFDEIYGDQQSIQALQNRILKGEKTLQNNFYYGIVKKENGKMTVSAMEKQLQPIAQYFQDNWQALPSDVQSKLASGEGLALALQIDPSDERLKSNIDQSFSAEINQTKQAQEADRQRINQERAKAGKPPLKPEEDEGDPLEEFKQYVFQPRFTQKATLKNMLGKEHEDEQFIAWPILQQIMTGAPNQHADVQKFSNDLLKLGFYQLHSSDLADSTGLRKAFAPMSQKLSAFKLAQKQYVESLDLGEVWPALLGGIAIGGGGETALEMAHMDNSPHAGAIRSGLLVGVDVFDNLLAQIPNVKQGMTKNGLSFNAKDITGEDDFGKYFSRLFKDPALKGKAGGTITDALKSALLGAGSGSIFAIPAGRTLSQESESAYGRAIMGGLGALGTSLSLPLKLQMDKSKTEAALKEMRTKGLIRKDLSDKAIKELAIQDAMAGTGNAASLKAFSLVPLLSGGLLALEKVGVPRKWTQKLYMSISPGAENLLSLVLMMVRQYLTSSKDMSAVEKRIMASTIQVKTPAFGFARFRSAEGSQKTEEDAKFIARQFNNGWGNLVGNFVTHPFAFYGTMASILAPMYGYSFLKNKLLGKPEEAPKPHAGESSKPEKSHTGQSSVPSTINAASQTSPNFQPKPFAYPSSWTQNSYMTPPGVVATPYWASPPMLGIHPAVQTSIFNSRAVLPASSRPMDLTGSPV